MIALAAHIKAVYSHVEEYYGQVMVLKGSLTRAFQKALLVPVSDLPELPAEARNGLTDRTPGWNFVTSLDDLLLDFNDYVLQLKREWKTIEMLYLKGEMYRQFDPSYERVSRENLDDLAKNLDKAKREVVYRMGCVDAPRPRIDVLRAGLKQLGLDWELPTPVLEWKRYTPPTHQDLNSGYVVLID